MDTRIEVIGIDHGWSMMKSVSEVFVTGIKEITTIPALYKDTLEYNGKYYRVGTNRQEVKNTKTEDDSFKLLTYAAVAKELKRRGLKESKVFLAVGLPLTRFGAEKKSFIRYLMEEKDVTFTFEQVRYHIVIDNVVVFPQCYAAVADRLPSFAKKTLVVDIRSWTIDIMLMIGASGVGKTAFFLYPNLEYACASGMSFLTTDTKGDLYRNYGAIAQDYYGYHVAVIDLRNPTRSDGNNMLHLVNTYMDRYLAEEDNLVAKAKAEKYAKIISKTIINASGENYGQNQFFYDAAEGLLTSVILLIAEYLPPAEVDGKKVDCRHIISVFKLVQDLLAPSKVKGKSQFQLLMDKLPSEHKTRWFAGAALNSAEQAMASVLSTVLSRLNAFLDSEMEQILCFETAIDAEKFCKEKSAVFIVLPEEDLTKYFMVSLMIQQLYREILAVADENGGKLKNRVMFYEDELGTLPAIESLELIFSASRSRRLSMVPIIQSFGQLEKNYGKEGAEIIVDNCQDTIFGGFAPNSQTAEVLSKALGSRTVMSGSVNRGRMIPANPCR